MTRVITLSPSENIVDGNFADNDIVLVKCDAIDEAFSFTMPSATGLNNVTFIIKKIDSSTNAVTIEFNGDETLDGVTSKTLSTQYHSVSVIGDYNVYFEHSEINSWDSYNFSDYLDQPVKTTSDVTHNDLALTGGLNILSDSDGVIFGAGGDMRIRYDGSHLYFDVLTSGEYIFDNRVNIISNSDGPLRIVSNDSFCSMRLSDPNGVFFFGTASGRGFYGPLNAVSSNNLISYNNNFGLGDTSPSEKVSVGGNLKHTDDNQYNYFGAGNDAGITYDGTNMLVNPKIVGSGAMLLYNNSKTCFRDTAIGICSQDDGYGDLFSDIAWRIGDSISGSPTNYTKISSNGDISFNGTAGFYPVRIAQSAQPTPDSGELVMWRDTDDGKIYMVYNDADSGVKQVEMT